MRKITLDEFTIDKLQGLTHMVDLCDESGKTIGFFQPLAVGDQPTPIRELCPYSDEEIRELVKQNEGKPLGDILKELGAA